MLRQVLCFTSLIVLTACSSTEATPPESEAKSSDGVVAVSAGAPLETGVGRNEIEFVEVSATVKSVDKKKRTITLIGPDKKTMTFDVDPAVKRLAEVKAGDKIFVQYFQSLAFEVREPTAEEKKAPKVVADAIGKNTELLPPGAAAARATHAIVTIVAIDRTRQTVTVKGPEGRVVEVQVVEPKNLKKIKIGDTVAVTYTEGIAVGINPAS